MLKPWSSKKFALGADKTVSPGLKVSSLVLTSVISSEYEESRMARLVPVEAEEWWLEPASVANAEEECIPLVEMTSGKPVTCKWAYVSVTVHKCISIVWVPSVVQTFLSGLGIIIETNLVPLGLEVVTSRVRILPLLVSAVGDDIIEKALGGDVVSVVSNPEIDSDLGPIKWEAADPEKPVFSLATLTRLIVPEPSDLSKVQSSVGVLWALGVVIVVPVSTEEALSVRSLPDVSFDLRPMRLLFSCHCLFTQGSRINNCGLAEVTVLSSDLSITELVVPLGIVTKLIAVP